MVAKLLTFFAFAAVVSQGVAVTTIWLPDETSTHLTNPHIPKTIGIAKSFLDTLVSCAVIFPNGARVAAYPVNNLPNTVYFLNAVQPFTSCSIGFRNSAPSLSGTYELLSQVRHSADLTETLTRQRFHLTFQEIDPWHAEVSEIKHVKADTSD